MISIVIPIKYEENIYWDLINNAIKSILRQTYKDYEIIISPYDKEVGQGRNNGIAKAKGEWILTLDADDTINENFLEKVISLTGYDIVTTDGMIEDYYFKVENIDINSFREFNRILNCSLFKKEIWEKYKFSEKLFGYEDWDFWLRALENGYKIGVINEPLVNISDRPESRNKEASKYHEELKKIIQ